jgi:prolyl 4-hydroxylase
MQVITQIPGKVWTIADFLSAGECALFISASEEAGYADAPITTTRGFVMRPDVRNNTRVIWDDRPLAAKLWARLAPLVADPLGHGKLKPIGLNERFRFYRYEPGQRFAPHFDGSYRRANGEESYVTLLLYLNSGCEGGQTRIEGPDDTLEIQPETGLALLFQHRLLHEGAPVTSGVKYVLRTDIMFESG